MAEPKTTGNPLSAMTRPGHLRQLQIPLLLVVALLALALPIFLLSTPVLTGFWLFYLWVLLALVCIAAFFLVDILPSLK